MSLRKRLLSQSTIIFAARLFGAALFDTSPWRRVGIEGYLRARTWEDDGKRRREVDVIARSIEFLTPARDGGAEVVPFEAAVA